MTDPRLTALAQEMRDIWMDMQSWSDQQSTEPAEIPVAMVERWAERLRNQTDTLDHLARQPLQHELNAWRELGEEMGRIISFMSKEQYEDLCPDWFGPRLFDMQAKAASAPRPSGGEQA